ncbi:MAG: lytic transglycosylase domain-containing protein [Alkalilacustris sp.]
MTQRPAPPGTARRGTAALRAVLGVVAVLLLPPAQGLADSPAPTVARTTTPLAPARVARGIAPLTPADPVRLRPPGAGLPAPLPPSALIRVPAPLGPVPGPAAFWSRVPTGGPGDPTRVLRALAVLEASPALRLTAAAPQALARIATRYGRAIEDATRGTAVSPALVLALIAVESEGRPTAISARGAQGLMQLVPATAERFGVADPFDPDQNLRGGVAYLDWLLRRHDGDIILALAAYNAGEGAVLRAGGVPPFAETRAYVPRVLAAWRVARRLCSPPPSLPTGPCTLSPGPAPSLR